MRSVILSTVLFLSAQCFFSFSAKACSCFPIGEHFCETIANDTSIHAIVMVRKLSTWHYGAQMEVITLVSGGAVPDTFTLWGDHGALCRRYVLGLNDGDTFIVAIHNTDLAGNYITNSMYPPNLEQTGDYHLSGCGVYFLDVNNGMVEGRINMNAEQSIPLSQFLAQPGTCLFGLGNEENAAGKEMVIFPNPAQDWIKIAFLGEDENDVMILDNLGRIVIRKQLQNGSELFVGDLDPGIYLMIASNPQEKRVLKLVKH